MKIDKKQLPQLIVLGVLVIICIGYLSFNVFKPKQSGSSPAAAEQQATADGEAAKGDEANAKDDALPPGTFPNLVTAAPRRDPFTPQVKPTELQPERSPTCVVRPSAAPRISEIQGGPLPANPFNGGISPTGAAVVPVEEKDPDFVLTGVVRGDENVAIIRVGDGGRHVVRQGQLIDGRYKVLRVFDDGAVLAYKNRRIHLRLGGAKNAS